MTFFLLLTVVGANAGAATAEDLIKQGLELRRAGRDSDALPKFEAAYNQSKSPRAAAQWGLCLQAISRWSAADPLLAEALTAANDPWVKKNRETIKESLEQVKAHIGRIEVLGDPAGALVFIAGKPAGSLPLPGAVSANEGSVDIEVSAPGYKRSTRTLNVVGASYQSVVFHLEPTSAPLPVSDAASATGQPEKPDGLTLAATPEATDGESRPLVKNPWLWVGLGAVVVSAVVTAVVLSSGKTYPDPDSELTIK